MRNQKGFTLIEVMVVVAILGILAAIAAPVIMGRNGDNQAGVEAKMMEYVRFQIPKVSVNNTRIKCQGIDADGDGYVRCEAIVDLGQEEAKSVQAECPSGYSLMTSNNDCTFPHASRAGYGY